MEELSVESIVKLTDVSVNSVMESIGFEGASVSAEFSIETGELISDTLPSASSAVTV